MIKDTIARIEAQIQNSTSLTPERREELNELLDTLKAEVNQLTDSGKSIVSRTVETGDAPELLQSSLDDLTQSAAKFEKSHPRLFQAAQSITNTLSNIGI
ncbi:MAG TPA: DUF4404 family protein [Verrucomicrobiae bacterium]